MLLPFVKVLLDKLGVNIVQFKEYQKRYYERFDKKINKVNLKRYLNKRGKKFLPYVTLGKKARILDVGCGEGIFVCYLKDKIGGSEVMGTDFSLRRCSLARKNLSENKFVVSDVEKLSFKDEKFDLVFANALLPHIFNVEQGINEMIRVCKSPGYVIIVEQNRFNFLIVLLSLLKKSERYTFKLSLSRIKVLLEKKTKKVRIYPVNSYIYPYRSFPPEVLRDVIGKLEDFLEIPILCTHYIMIAET